MGHTSEPWSIDSFGNIKTPEGQLLLGGVRTPMTAGVGMDKANANARRIAACVNACAGISTEYLETLIRESSSIHHEMMQRIQNKNTAERACKNAEQQRDELLAALEEIKALGRNHKMIYAHQIADAAIAKVKGGSFCVEVDAGGKTVAELQARIDADMKGGAM